MEMSKLIPACHTYRVGYWGTRTPYNGMKNKSHKKIDKIERAQNPMENAIIIWTTQGAVEKV